MLNRITFKSSLGKNLSVIEEGSRERPPILLLHGFPSSANSFRDIIPVLAESAYVIAPDLPGYGESEILPTTSFAAYADVIGELLDHLGAGPRFIYLHDFGAAVGFQLAMRAPDQVLGLVIQNANAHRTGFGPEWEASLEFGKQPNEENSKVALQHLTLEGTRAQYVSGVPEEVAKRISPEVWEEDWRIMSQPGHLDVQRSLIRDYASTYVDQFDAIAKYLSDSQPPALMLWGRHDAFFLINEVLSWLEDLPRMEAHIFDGGHFLLETHAEPSATLIRDFIAKTA